MSPSHICSRPLWGAPKNPKLLLQVVLLLPVSFSFFFSGPQVPLLSLSFSELSRVQPTEGNSVVRKKKKRQASNMTLNIHTAQQVLKQTFSRCFRGQKRKQACLYLGSQEASGKTAQWCCLSSDQRKIPWKSRDSLKDPPNPVGLHWNENNVFLHVTWRDKES